DEFGNVDYELGAGLVRIVRRAHLAYTHAYNVVEPAVAFAVAEVKYAADDLPSARWVGAAISVPLDQDCRTVVGIDGGAKVRTERSGGGSALREVRAPEATTDGTLAAALGDKQVLLPPAVELDHPTLRIGEANPIQRLESQNCTPVASRPDVSGEHYRTDLAAPTDRRAAALAHPEPLFRNGARPHGVDQQERQYAPLSRSSRVASSSMESHRLEVSTCSPRSIADSSSVPQPLARG